ncbi:MAG TPA: alpha/beta hydrolase [Sandaracinaceae bacterium LLY-WYZ-13_1]|nr:alpha/beta hydrolase [Sandaracinaceae bacterium LLY-WYZ-13_1]
MEPSRAIERHDDVVYATLSGRPMHLDVVVPRDADRPPLVMLFHGGAFLRGDENAMHTAAGRLAALGYASAAVEYRAIGEDRHDFPDGLADARCAVRFLRAEAERFGIDAERTAVVGFSAGGYFAASLALQADEPGLDGDCPRRGDASVRGAVAYFAPLDLRPSADWSAPSENLFEDMLGGAPEDHPDRAARASPVASADPEDAPLLVVSGDRDDIVPIARTRAAVEHARRGGAPVALVTVEGASHGFGWGSADAPAKASCATAALLRSVLDAP